MVGRGYLVVTVQHIERDVDDLQVARARRGVIRVRRHDLAVEPLHLQQLVGGQPPPRGVDRLEEAAKGLKCLPVGLKKPSVIHVGQVIITGLIAVVTSCITI